MIADSGLHNVSRTEEEKMEIEMGQPDSNDPTPPPPLIHATHLIGSTYALVSSLPIQSGTPLPRRWDPAVVRRGCAEWDISAYE